MIWDNTCTGANWNPSWTFIFATCWLLWFDQLLWDCLISFITFDYFGKDQLFSCVPWRPSLCFCALGKSISCIIWHFLDFDQIGTIGAFLDSNIFNGTNFFQRWPCDLKTVNIENKQLWALFWNMNMCLPNLFAQWFWVGFSSLSFIFTKKFKKPF